MSETNPTGPSPLHHEGAATLNRRLRGLRDKPDGFVVQDPPVGQLRVHPAGLAGEGVLRAVGLDADISAVNQQTADDRGANGDYEMAIQSFGGLSGDPSGLITRFTSNTRSTSFTLAHGYNNSEFDKLANEQAVEFDPVKRKQLVDQMQAILAEDLPQISLYVPEQVTFVDSKRFDGFAYTPGCPPAEPPATSGTW